MIIATCHIRLGKRSLVGRGFSVVEILVAVSIMTVIVLGLYKMFDQTQRALRGNINQTDVLESGRAAIDLITRELEQASPLNIPNGTNLFTTLSRIPNEPMIQELTEGVELRTNILQDLFFISRVGHQVTGTGYRVLYATNGVGTLARFSRTLHSSLVNSSNLALSFLNAAPTNFVRLAEGVVHFKITPYDSLGHQIHSLVSPGRIVAVPEFRARDVAAVQFMNQDLPPHLELELAYLEAPAADQARSLPTLDAARRFLAKQVGRIHIFRQRIPIRTSDLNR